MTLLFSAAARRRGPRLALALVATAVLLSACGEKKDAAASQTAAKATSHSQGGWQRGDASLPRCPLCRLEC